MFKSRSRKRFEYDINQQMTRRLVNKISFDLLEFKPLVLKYYSGWKQTNWTPASLIN